MRASSKSRYVYTPPQESVWFRPKNKGAPLVPYGVSPAVTEIFTSNASIDCTYQLISFPPLHTVPLEHLLKIGKVTGGCIDARKNTEFIHQYNHKDSSVAEKENLQNAAKNTLLRMLNDVAPKRLLMRDEISGDLDILQLRNQGERFFEERRILNTDKTIMLYLMVHHSWCVDYENIRRAQLLILGMRDALTAAGYKLYAYNVYPTSPGPFHQPGALTNKFLCLEPIIKGTQTALQNELGCPVRFRSHGFRALASVSICASLGSGQQGNSDEMRKHTLHCFRQHSKGKRLIAMRPPNLNDKDSALTYLQKISTNLRKLVITNGTSAVTIGL